MKLSTTFLACLVSGKERPAGFDDKAEGLCETYLTGKGKKSIRTQKKHTILKEPRQIQSPSSILLKALKEPFIDVKLVKKV